MDVRAYEDGTDEAARDDKTRTTSTMYIHQLGGTVLHREWYMPC